MSSMGMLIRNTFINKNAPLNNGVGRFIPQLARITLKVTKYFQLVEQDRIENVYFIINLALQTFSASREEKINRKKRPGYNGYCSWSGFWIKECGIIP